jgi:hypothetical protein
MKSFILLILICASCKIQNNLKIEKLQVESKIRNIESRNKLDSFLFENKILKLDSTLFCEVIKKDDSFTFIHSYNPYCSITYDFLSNLKKNCINYNEYKKIVIISFKNNLNIHRIDKIRSEFKDINFYYIDYYNFSFYNHFVKKYNIKKPNTIFVIQNGKLIKNPSYDENLCF